MTTFALTVSTSDLGLGVISGARVVVDRKRTQVADAFSSQYLGRNIVPTNSLGVATILLEPDDGSVYHEMKIFDLAGILVYSRIFTMPPQAVSSLSDLPVQDIVSASAAAVLEGVATATAQAVISTAQAAIATTQAGLATTNGAEQVVLATAQAVIATNQAGLATTNGEAQVDLAEAQVALATAKAVLTAADRVQTGLDVIATAADRVQTGLDAVATAASRDAALLSRGLWQTTAQGIGNGVAGTASLVAGSGGTNGTFALAFSGGTQVIAPEGYFVVAGGSVTQVVITYAGHYSAGVPTLSFAASAGLTGASATSVMGANTPIGQYFSVPVTGSNDSLILYKVTTGPAATEITRYPSSMALDFVKREAPFGFAWSVSDEAGFAAIGVKDDGTFVADTSEIKTLNGEAYTPAHTVAAAPFGFKWAVLDVNESAAIGVKDDGTFVVSELEAFNITVDTINGLPVGSSPTEYSPQFASEINHIPTYGQSLSIGTLASPPISTTQPYDSIMFNSGVTVSGSRTSFTPMIEQSVETPASGTAEAIKELIFEDDGLSYTSQSYQLLFSADGAGGRTIAQLAIGGSHYAKLTASMQAGFDLAQASSKTFGVPAVTWTQGEADYSIGTTIATYKSALSAMRTQMESTAAGIAGASDPLKMITYQLASHKAYSVTYPTIALALLAASKEDEHIHLATPMYPFTHNASDNVHLTAASSKKLGFYYGLAFKRVIIDKQDWKPVMPISKTVQGKLALVRFNVPMGKLVIDTTLVAANTNHGFNLFDAGGTEVAITSVEIVGPDTVKIVSTINILAGFKLQYAFYGTGTTGPLVGPRGNLRDTQGDSIVFDPAGLNYPAHNWCVMFEEIF